jgi:hypothetical protein
VLAICGQAEATVRGASYQQELNLDRMFADVAVFAQEASAPAQVRHLIDRCVRVAQASNGPSVLILPKDVQDEDYEEPAVAHGFTRSGIGYSKPKIVPEDADLTKAADILNAGNKVAILIGAGARGTAPQLIQMATLLGAGVAKALLGPGRWAGTCLRNSLAHRPQHVAYLDQAAPRSCPAEPLPTLTSLFASVSNSRCARIIACAAARSAGSGSEGVVTMTTQPYSPLKILPDFCCESKSHSLTGSLRAPGCLRHPPVNSGQRGHREISIRVTMTWRIAMRSRSLIRVIRFTAAAID